MEEDDDSIDLVAVFRTLRRERWFIFRGHFGECRNCHGRCIHPPQVAILQPCRSFRQLPPAAVRWRAWSPVQLSTLGASDLLGNGKTSGDLYAGCLASRSVASELVARFETSCTNLQGDKGEPCGKGSRLVDHPDPRSQINPCLTHGVRIEKPERARDIANAYMDSLRETNRRLALDQSSQRRLFFGEQLEKEKDDLENAEVELKKTGEQSGLIAPCGQTEDEIGTIANAAQIAGREVQLAALRDSQGREKPDVIRLRSEIDDLQGNWAVCKEGATGVNGGDPDFQGPGTTAGLCSQGTRGMYAKHSRRTLETVRGGSPGRGA